MENQTPTPAISKCVEHVSQIHSGKNRKLIVADLFAYIRDERLSEVTDWSTGDLDAVERHAGQFAFDTPLERVLEPGFMKVDAGSSGETWINSPSPFAWT